MIPDVESCWRSVRVEFSNTRGLQNCIAHFSFLEKLLEMLLYQNESINQERGRHRIPKMASNTRETEANGVLDAGEGRS